MFLNKELCANGINLRVETRIALLDKHFPWHLLAFWLSLRRLVSPNLVPRSPTVIRKGDLVKFDFEHAQCQRGPKYELFYHCACLYSLL